MSEDDAYEVLARNCDLSRGEDMHKYWCGEQYEYRGLPHPVVARSLHALVRKVFVMAVFSSNDDFFTGLQKMWPNLLAQEYTYTCSNI